MWLRQKWADLFQAGFEVLLYELTSTYFEGAMEQNHKAKHGHSRDQRTDCLQVVIALVITPDGFRLAYEVMNGNTSNRATLRGFSGPDREDLWKSKPHAGDGSRHSERSDLAGDARSGPGEGHEVTRETFQFRVDKKKLQAAEWRDGHYLLRSNLTANSRNREDAGRCAH